MKCHSREGGNPGDAAELIVPGIENACPESLAPIPVGCWCMSRVDKLLELLCGPPSPQTPAGRRKQQQHRRCRLGNGGICHGA